MTNIELGIRPLGFPSASEMNVRFSVENGFDPLIKKIEFERFERDLPKVSDEQIVSVVTTAALEPFKKGVVHGFGNEWNRLTAIAAAQTLGWPTDHLVRILKKDTLSAQRLKQQQAEIAKAWEQACELKVMERSEQLSPEVAKLIWVQKKSEICDRLWQEITETRSCTPEKVKISVLGALVGFINRFGEQSFDRSDLIRKIITAVAKGQPIIILNLFCPPFRNSSDGINVTQLQDPMTVFRGGRKDIVSLRDFAFVDEVSFVKAIFERNGIACSVISPIIDIDAFVMSGQEEVLEQNCLSLNSRFSEIGACKISQILEVASLDDPKNKLIHDEWQRRFSQTDRLTTRLVDQMFDKLKRRDLPKEMKTREFAVFMAKRRFICHFLIGQRFPDLFPTGVVLLRGMGTELIEVDKIGARSVGKSLFVVTH